MQRDEKRGEGEVREKERGGRKRRVKELCERKEKEENGRWEKRVMEAKRVNELWEIVNKERRARKRVSENIEMEVWKEHFMRLRGGVECRVVKGE